MYSKRLPEGKPPFSYGFPMGFPMVFLWLYHYNPVLQQFTERPFHQRFFRIRGFDMEWTTQWKIPSGQSFFFMAIYHI